VRGSGAYLPEGAVEHGADDKLALAHVSNIPTSEALSVPLVRDGLIVGYSSKCPSRVAPPTPLGIAPELRARFCNNQRVKQQQLAMAVHTHTIESVHNTAPSNDSRVHSSPSETLLNASSDDNQ